jgi:hypothetical protein
MQIRQRAEAVKALISESYDAELESKASGKRKREEDPEAAAKAAEKKANTQKLAQETDWQVHHLFHLSSFFNLLGNDFV